MINIIDDFIDAQEAATLISQSRANLKPIIQTWGDHKRECDAAWNKLEDSCLARIHGIATLGKCSRVQIARYAIGKSYPPHMDENDSTPVDKRRHKTAVVYLNTPDEGGATYFPELDVRVEAITGRLLIFDSIDQDGKIDPMSLHTSEEVMAGEKWTATMWFQK